MSKTQNRDERNALPLLVVTSKTQRIPMLLFDFEKAHPDGKPPLKNPPFILRQDMRSIQLIRTAHLRRFLRTPHLEMRASVTVDYVSCFTPKRISSQPFSLLTQLPWGSVASTIFDRSRPRLTWASCLSFPIFATSTSLSRELQRHSCSSWQPDVEATRQAISISQ